MTDQLRVIAAAYLVHPITDDPRILPTIISAPPPARHHNLVGLVYYATEACLIEDVPSPDSSGFLLSDGTFADRERACVVAVAAGQTSLDRMTVPGTLFSEDLW